MKIKSIDIRTLSQIINNLMQCYHLDIGKEPKNQEHTTQRITEFLIEKCGSEDIQTVKDIFDVSEFDISEKFPQVMTFSIFSARFKDLRKRKMEGNETKGTPVDKEYQSWVDSEEHENLKRMSLEQCKLLDERIILTYEEWAVLCPEDYKEAQEIRKRNALKLQALGIKSMTFNKGINKFIDKIK
jgi:hypothetical protein